MATTLKTEYPCHQLFQCVIRQLVVNPIERYFADGCPLHHMVCSNWVPTLDQAIQFPVRLRDLCSWFAEGCLPIMSDEEIAAAPNYYYRAQFQYSVDVADVTCMTFDGAAKFMAAKRPLSDQQSAEEWFWLLMLDQYLAKLAALHRLYFNEQLLRTNDLQAIVCAVYADTWKSSARPFPVEFGDGVLQHMLSFSENSKCVAVKRLRKQPPESQPEQVEVLCIVQPSVGARRRFGPKGYFCFTTVMRTLRFILTSRYKNVSAVLRQLEPHFPVEMRRVVVQ